MKDDPFYLSEEASLGVLSVDGNFNRVITYNLLNLIMRLGVKYAI